VFIEVQDECGETSRWDVTTCSGRLSSVGVNRNRLRTWAAISRLAAELNHGAALCEESAAEGALFTGTCHGTRLR